MDLPDPQSGPTAGEAPLAALIARLVERDEQALTLLYDATLPRVWSIVLRHAHGNWAVAEEVVEDVYWQVWRDALRFDPARGPPLAWLLTIARSRAIDAQRRELRLRSSDGGAAVEATDPAPQPPELLALTREAQRLHLALAQLKGQERELLVLAFFRGLTHHEIALKTALPPGTVKSRIRRSLLMLRRWLDMDDPRALDRLAV